MTYDEKVTDGTDADGLWRASLLDPEHFATRETSGSALFCYAIAWGINNGILDRAIYYAVDEKAWQGLVDCVDENGRLGTLGQWGAPPRGPREPGLRWVARE